MAQEDNNRPREEKTGDSRARIDHKALIEHSGKTEEEEEQPGYGYKDKESTQQSRGRFFFEGFQVPGSFPPPGQPITEQPMKGGRLGSGVGIPGSYSPGLEFLSSTDHLFVIQQVQLTEVLTGFELNNKYFIKNHAGVNVFFAIEDTHWCTRNVCSALRAFHMRIFDSYGTEVIHLRRPFACDNCCTPCCLQTMDIFSPPDELIGTIKQKWTLWYPKFALRDAYGETILRIEGPSCTTSMCGTNVNFKVMTVDGSSEVGRVVKHWAGMAQEFMTDADIFGISFPMELDVRMKAVLLGACFLIDFMYFENTDRAFS